MVNKEFATDVYRAAQSGEVSPFFTCAQACLETGWGKSKIGEYNLWGIKAYNGYKGKRVLVRTTEVMGGSIRLQEGERVISKGKLNNGQTRYVCELWFKDYSSLQEAVLDHERVLMNFTDAWKVRQFAGQFLRAIQSGKRKYATDPNYVKSMMSMFNTLGRIGIKEYCHIGEAVKTLPNTDQNG